MNTLRVVCLLCVNMALSQSAGAAWTWTRLDFPGATNTYAYGISGDTIVGTYVTPDAMHGFIYDGSTWVTVTHPQAEGRTVVSGISDDRIAGWFTPDPLHLQDSGFIYDGLTWASVGITGRTRALGIYMNKVVGYYDYRDPITRITKSSGFVYDGDTYTYVRYPNADITRANAMWEDTIVGQYVPDWGPGFVGYAFIYDGQTWATVAKEGASSTRLLGIEGSRMVGTWYGDNYSRTGFLLEGGTWTDFACPWSTQTEAYGISGDRIVGYYRDTDGNAHGYLLTIPEPTAAALLAVGGLALARRRRWRPHRMGKGGQP